MSHVYNARVRMCHGDLDAFGRAHVSAYLRHLAQVAIDASGDAGFDAAWYDAAGARWLVRRTTFTLARPARAGTTLALRTWVEDFRRVRSRRRYEASGAGDVPALAAVTDWVFVDVASGRPRRVPPEMVARFGVPATPAAPRSPWRAAPATAPAGRATHRVRWVELDALGHMNNAAWLDVLVQGALDVLRDRDWPIARLAATGAAPWVTGGDVEYLDEARDGDVLETATWFDPRADGLDVHQIAARHADGPPVARAHTTWRWADARTDAPAPAPAGLVAAVASGRAG